MFKLKGCGLDDIYLLNGYEEIETEEGKAYSVHDLDGLLSAIARSLTHKDGLLTPKEFRFLRIELDLSQKALGTLTGYTDQTIANWEKGKTPLPIAADKIIRDLYLDSIEEGPIAGLLKKLAELDREYHELTLKLQQSDDGSWKVLAA